MSRTLARVTKLVQVDGHAHQLLHLTEVGGKRRLEVMIGRAALHAIRSSLLDDKNVRPITSELCASVIGGLKGTVHETEIHDYDNGTYFAELRLSSNDGSAPIALDCRPSDAIAICLQVTAPIYISETVWDKVNPK
ncbi:MAG: bifunctional nuclease family protein [Planctomycetes bacterium]|nr:bifunctional nuclease family protein [Planctomycetota bacterium]